VRDTPYERALAAPRSPRKCPTTRRPLARCACRRWSTWGIWKRCSWLHNPAGSH